MRSQIQKSEFRIKAKLKLEFVKLKSGHVAQSFKSKVSLRVKPRRGLILIEK